MIVIYGDKIPRLEVRPGPADNWGILCEGRIIASGLSEYMARMLAAAPKMLDFLDRASRREHALLRIPIETLLAQCGIKFWRPGDGNDDGGAPKEGV